MGRRPRASASEVQQRVKDLPVQITAFVGRDAERAELKRLLANARLLTVTGAGGMGKTRLALEVAAELGSRQPDGATWLELAPLPDPTLIPEALASALGVVEARSQPLVATLAAHLHDKELLLFLDNCEHLTDGCAELVVYLLHRCPGLRVLATSREPLGVPGEIVWQIPPLSLADPQVATGTDEIGGSEAVRLFVDRARSVLPGFALDDHNAQAISEICRHLDGIPLALELAAARITVLSPEQIVQRLDHRFELLTGGSRTLPSRQQTLVATLDWSYQLLTEAERTLFRRVAVFAGGWTLQAAEAICADDALPLEQVLELLHHLIDKSLVLADTSSGEARYWMLETLRVYGGERLTESDERDVLQRRHASWCVDLAEQWEPELRASNQRLCLDRLKRDEANFRAALAWACASEEVELGLRVAGALTWFWALCGRAAEGQFWLEECLRMDADRPPSPPRAKAQIGAAVHAWVRGDSIKAKDYLDASLAYSQSITDQQGQVEALCGLAVIHLTLGDVEGSQRIAEACMDLSRTIGNSWTTARTLHTFGVIHLERGNPEAARVAFEDEACLAREMGDPLGLAMALSSLGDVARTMTDEDWAANLYEEALGLMQGLGVVWWVPDLLHNLGYVALRRGEVERARQLFADGLERFRNVGDRRGAALCFIGLAGVAQATGGSTDAARLLGAARWLLSMTDTPLWAPNAVELERIERATVADLGPDAFAAASTESSVLQLAQFRVDPAGMLPARPVGLIAEAERGGTKSKNPLSQREREVASLVGRGLTNREIAGSLFVAERTVEAHVTHILNKLDLRSRAQIAVWAAEHGLLAASDPLTQ